MRAGCADGSVKCLLCKHKDPSSSLRTRVKKASWEHVLATPVLGGETGGSGGLVAGYPN